MNTRIKIDQLLTDYINSNHEAYRKKIESDIWKNFGRTGAIFILDMSYFSIMTKTHGIVYYLSLIKKMQQTVGPILSNRSGHIVKFEADNVFAYFDTSMNALQAGIDIKIAIEAVNNKYPHDQEILISIGIDYGEFLYFYENQDFFGDPVNIASKLGEDLAGKGEILMTENAYMMVPDMPYKSEEEIFEISGIRIKTYKIIYP